MRKQKDLDIKKPISLALSMSSIVHVVVFERKRRGCGEKEFARMLGITTRELRQMESYKKLPRLDSLLEILYTLGYDLCVKPLPWNTIGKDTVLQ